MKTDIKLTLINNNLVSICREMGVAMMKTAYSPVFNEGFDFVCALFDRDGKMIAQAEYNPSMLGAAHFTVDWVLNELGSDAFGPGDVWVHNDPYRGGCHLPEHMLIKGIFHENELIAFAACIGHLAEIGGKAVGGLPGDATEVYQEGLQMPPVKLMDASEHVMDIWKILMTNHRTPRLTWGDLHAMLGALVIGERGVAELLQSRSIEQFEYACAELIVRSEKWMRDEIGRIPDGEYAFEDVMENDGISDASHRIKVLLTVRDKEIIADFKGSDPQTRGPINATYAVTAAATYNAVFHLTDANIPRNAGCNRPIKVLAPPGSIVNARRPAAEVGGNSETHCRMIGIVMGALAQAVPERAAAADGATGCNFLFGGIHPDTGQYYANYHFENVGWGASTIKDGNDSQCAPLAISRNVPVEVFESRYPILVRGFRLLPDSGGCGQHRGGLGTERVFEVMADEITISALFDRMQIPPWGLKGGGKGGTTEIAYQAKSENNFKSFTEAFGTVSPSKFTNIIVFRGDRIRIASSGGGGFGNPALRPVQSVLDDVHDRYISPASAQDNYLVVLDRAQDKWQVNDEKTARLRGGK